jgi:peptide/nickel transport system permease protein
MGRKVVALVFTLIAAAAIAQVFFATTIDDQRLAAAIADTPSALVDRFVHGDFGSTPGASCIRRDPTSDYIPLCASYNPATIAHMLRTRVPIDISLLLGGLLFGTLVGIAGGRWCATRPFSRGTKGLHAITRLQLSSPPFFQALVVLFYFSANSSNFVRLPFVSSQGDYAAFGHDPLLYLKAMWVPWVLVGLPLAAFVLRLTETTLRENLQEDFVRTARAKGLSERQVVNHQALPVAVPGIAAMVGVNVGMQLLTVAVVEYAFSIPGMFSVIYAAGMHRDVPVMEGIVIEGVILVTLANFLVDALQARLDPRVSLRRPRTAE